MQLSPRTRLLGVLIAGLLVSGALGFTAISLKKSRDTLALDLAASERKSDQLAQKYKEEKAQVGRLQRSTMTLEGRIRQAGMDYAKLEKEHAALKERSEVELKGRIDACEADRMQLNERFEKISADFSRLEGQHRETSAALKSGESENKTLKGEVQGLKAELKQAGQENQRFRAHNVKLSQIARELVGRIEKTELGRSVLVKEPVLQFQKIELEKMLQDYLDRIDEGRIVY